MISHGLRVNTVYITKGGYLVEIVGRHLTRLDLWQSSLRTSPGVNVHGTPAKDIPTLNGLGWCYRVDGSITSLGGNWNSDLELVAEVPDLTQLDFTNLPSSFGFVNGYPKLKEKKKESTVPGYLDNEKLFESSNPVTPSQDKNVKSVVGFAKRMFAYWLYEPTKTIALQAAKSARYALVLSVLGSAGYGSIHPDHIKNFVLKCLPKVSVQAPEIMR